MSIRQAVLRASLPATRPSPGFGGASFSLPCKKLILEYCETWGSSMGARAFIDGQQSQSTAALASMAARNPGVEFVVRRRPFRHPVLRGHYLNNRDKVICIRNLDPKAIAQKAQLLLDSSGRKLQLEKGHPVQSTTESVRGIYSPFHTPIQVPDTSSRARRYTLSFARTFRSLQ